MCESPDTCVRKIAENDPRGEHPEYKKHRRLPGNQPRFGLGVVEQSPGDDPDNGRESAMARLHRVININVWPMSNLQSKRFLCPLDSSRPKRSSGSRAMSVNVSCAPAERNSAGGVWAL